MPPAYMLPILAKVFVFANFAFSSITTVPAFRIVFGALIGSGMLDMESAASGSSSIIEFCF